MAENINIGTRIVGATNQTDNLLIEKYCFNDIEDSCDVYGGLYQWNEMMQYVLDTGAQGICPPTGGWHIPSDEEWTSLVNYLDGPSIAGGKMKSTGTIEAGTGLWFSPNTGATNESGFTGLPDGIRRYTDGYFFQHGDIGHFWSSTQGIVPSAMSRRLSYGNTSVSRFSDFNRNSGFSVRCILN